jgi:hypothetical protein
MPKLCSEGLVLLRTRFNSFRICPLIRFTVRDFRASREGSNLLLYQSSRFPIDLIDFWLIRASISLAYSPINTAAYFDSQSHVSFRMRFWLRRARKNLLFIVF